MRAALRQALFVTARLVDRLPRFPGRNRLFAIILRLAQRLGPPIVVDVDGFSLRLDMRDGLCRGIWLDRRFVQGRALEELVRPGDVVVDVGANVGHLALIAARKAGPAGRVIAIEPGARSYRLLADNAARNFPDRIHPVHAACDERDGTATLYVSDYSEEFNSLRPDTVIGGVHRETVGARSLDSLCSELRVAPDVVKVDVEGAEWQVLRGLLGGSLAPPRALLVEVYAPNAESFGYRPSELCAWLRERGYELELSRDTERFPYSDGRADGPLLHDVVATRA